MSIEGGEIKVLSSATPPNDPSVFDKKFTLVSSDNYGEELTNVVLKEIE